MTRIFLSLVPFLSLLAPAMAADPERPNILFIAVDDLRPELACYGVEHIHSPNIDRLASQSTLFERAYCMVPTCGASRASLMTSIRPSRHRFINYLAWAERDAPNAKPMNTHFQEQGYHTVSLGKIFHHPEDHAEGWSEPAWRPERANPYQLPENQKIRAASKRNRGPAWESADVPDNAYADGRLAERAIEELQELHASEEPFFLAVGFFKPHLPFIAPKKYWDLYDEQDIQLPENGEIPKNAPKEAIHDNGELHGYPGIPKSRTVPDEMAKTLIHGYSACVSYTDAQIGKVLEELDRLGLADNTIIVLWGDHGWSLGEHTLWHKHSCFDVAMRVPLLVHVPGIPGGQRSERLIESIDIYPTLCELAELPRPDHLQGQSFVPLLKDPNGEWKTAAIGRFRDGDTIRTDQYRFTEYTNQSDERTATMLYNYGRDPGETVNIAADEEETSRRLVESLHEKMGRDKPKKKGPRPGKTADK